MPATSSKNYKFWNEYTDKKNQKQIYVAHVDIKGQTGKYVDGKTGQ